MTSKTLYDYCLTADRGDLLSQWDETANGELTPRMVTPGSHKTVFWRCAHGHTWQARVYSRTYGQTGCPVCRGMTPTAGRGLAAYPELLPEWHPTKNGLLSPGEIAPGSHRKVWWRCSHGHEWTATVKSRTSGAGCPVCRNRKILPSENDLLTTHPALCQEWHRARNGALSPDSLGAGSSRKVWWRCPQGHEWQATVVSRAAGGTGCPVCAGKVVLPGVNDLESTAPGISAQWHPTKNGALTPRDVTPQSNRRAWWLCPQGHAYHAVIASRVQKASGCPYCSNRRVLSGFNDLATTEPQLAKEWHPARNGALAPGMVTAGSHKKVWWQCGEGHEWQAMVYSRTGEQRAGCPVCAGRRPSAGAARYRAILAEAHLSDADRDF